MTGRQQLRSNDIPGTIVFTGELARKGFGLNQFCMSLMKSDNRARFTEHTIFEEAALRREIAQCRAKGYAVSVEEHSVGVNSVAVAVDDGHSISVAMPSPRFSEDFERRTIAALEDAAQGLASPLPQREEGARAAGVGR